MNALADQKHEAEQNFHGGAPRSAVPDEEVDIIQNQRYEYSVNYNGITAHHMNTDCCIRGGGGHCRKRYYIFYALTPSFHFVADTKL